MAMSFVIIVMKAWISEPVASVPMNESTPMITTTKPLITPTSRAMPRPSPTAGTTERLCSRK